MRDAFSPRLREALNALLDESLTAPLPEPTRRIVPGSLSLPGKATVVVGMRRAGKTWFLHQIRRDWLAAGWARDRLPYLNFEDERLTGLTALHLTHVIEEYYRRFPLYRQRQTVAWSLDEIQCVPGWERFVRRLLDSEKVALYLTGSSAALLSREIASSLRGRAWEVPLFPFSFEEFLRHQGVAGPNGRAISAADRSRIEHEFRRYLRQGGFPEAQGLHEEDRRRLLTQYVDVALLRDVIERHQVSNVLGLRWLARHLLANPCGKFSVEKFHAAVKSQGIAISRDTVHEMLGYLEDCFLIRTCWLNTASERRRMVHPRKAYPVDPGLIEVFDRTGRPNVGHALETAVRVELERRGMAPAYVVTPEGYEVDFVVRSADGQTELIQVCATADNSETLAREVRALVDAKAEYPRATLRLLTLDYDLVGEVPADVNVTRASDWFLGRDGQP